jgi:hypothetical protein
MLQCNYNKNENYLSHSSIFDTPGRSKTSKRKSLYIYTFYTKFSKFTKIYKNLQNLQNFSTKFTELPDLQGLDFHLIILKLFDVV